MAEPVEHPPTVSESSTAAMEVFNSVKVSLADLCAKGTAQFAHKNYEEAADLYARASELQAELNGEMSSDNAEILFLYGRSLFKLGQSKSDVLGGRTADDKKQPAMVVKPREEHVREEVRNESEKNAEGEILTTSEDTGIVKPEGVVGAKKPLFQFTGDENFEDSDSDEEGREGEAEGEEEEDDLAVAFEVLDLARVLFTKKLEDPEHGAEGNGEALSDTPMTKHIKERLAETHDLLAEISLENERFPGAVTDFRAALVHKQELYPQESEIIAEAHFKLSLALEFASISKAQDKAEGDVPAMESDSFIDQELRDEAVHQLEAAINSTKLKLQNKEVELASMHSPDDNDVTRAQIVDVKEILADMESRLAELKHPAINMKEALYGPEAIGGILGAALGRSPFEAAATIEEAKKGAKDLTGLIRRKKPTKDMTLEPATGRNGTNSKRKAESGVAETGDAKKLKVSDLPGNDGSEQTTDDHAED